MAAGILRLADFRRLHRRDFGRQPEPELDVETLLTGGLDLRGFGFRRQPWGYGYRGFEQRDDGE